MYLYNKLYHFTVHNIHAYVLLCNKRNTTVCCKFPQLHSYQILLQQPCYRRENRVFAMVLKILIGFEFYNGIMRFLYHSTAFLYRSISATVQMLKLHKVCWFHGGDTKSQQQPKIMAHSQLKPRWSILSTIPIISTHLYSMTFVRHSQSHKSQLQGHKFTTRNTYLQLSWCSLDAGIHALNLMPPPSNLSKNPHTVHTLYF